MKLTLLLIPLLFFMTSCAISSSWQGTYYKDGDTLGKPEYSPVFTDFSSCKNWVITKASGNDKYTCNKNCKNIGNNDLQECEIVVRNWIINEGSITFSSYKE